MTKLTELEEVLKKGWVIESIHYDADNNGFVADVSDPEGNICIRGDKSLSKAIEKAIKKLS